MKVPFFFFRAFYFLLRTIKFMIFGLFKKKITSEKIATNLYHSTISAAIKNSLEDQAGNAILTKTEQSLMLAQHLFSLMERLGLEKAKLYVLTTYVVNNHRIKSDDDLPFEMAIALDSMKKVGEFFRNLPSENDRFFKQKFLFDKDLDPFQKTLAIQWHMSHCKKIDSGFNSYMKEFKISDEK